MHEKIQKLRWSDKAREFELFHLGKIANHKVALAKGMTIRPNWTQRDTARELSVSQPQVLKQLKLALGLRVWPEIERFKTADLAMEYIRKKSKGKSFSWSPPNEL